MGGAFRTSPDLVASGLTGRAVDADQAEAHTRASGDRQGDESVAQEEGRAGIGGVRVPDYLRPTYANFLNVNHTPWDFRLMFAVVKAPMPGGEQEAVMAAGEVNPDAVAEIIIPANLMHGLIGALQQGFSRYLAEYGPPGIDPSGPQPQAE